MNYSTINIEQGTDAWKRWRRSGFGASDISVIMGENRFKTYRDLIGEKQNGISPGMNEAMARGVQLEPIARSAYIARTKIEIKPVCIQHNDFSWARASLDGLSIAGDKVVEIKCGHSSYVKARQYGMIPDYYMGQLQHIMFITGLKSVDYWAFDPNLGGVLIIQQRNDVYIENIIQRCEKLKGDLPTGLD